MTILVFGKTGQVATELQREAKVAALGRDKADLTNPQLCYDAIISAQPKAVINAAAYTAVDKAESESDLAFAINGKAPEAMARACYALGIPLVHISTDYVFNGTGSSAWMPTDATEPLNIYGASKLAGEEAIRGSGANAAILRTSWVFSAHGNNFLRTMLRLGADRDALTIVGDQIGGPTPARAIADACFSIARQMNDGKAGRTFHFSGAPDVSWADFARFIFETAELDVSVTNIPTSDYPTPATRPLNSRMDCSNLDIQFGISRPDWQAATKAIVKELS